MYLTLDNPELTAPPPRWDFGVPTNSSLRVRVHNPDTAASGGYALYWYWEANGTRWPLNEDDARSFDVGAPLAPGQSRTHSTVDGWNLQPYEKGAGAVVVRVEERDFKESELPLVIPIHNFTLEAQGSSQRIGPDGTAILRLRIANSGTVSESFTLATVTDTEDQRLDAKILPASLLVLPGEEEIARMRVHYPYLGNDQDFSKSDYVIEARVVSFPARVFRTGTLARLDIDHALPAPHREMSLSPEHLETSFANPGSQVETKFILRNLGSASESFLIRAEAAGGWTVQSATVAVDGVVVNEAPLESNETASIIITAQSPTAPAGRPGNVSAQATAYSAQPIRATGNAALRLRGAAPVPQSVLLRTPGPYFGEPVLATVSLRNVGNEAVPPSGSVRTVATFNNGASVVRAQALAGLGQGEPLDAKFDFGPALAPGPFTITATVPSGPGDPPITLDGVVRQGAVSLRSPMPLSGLPGESVPYRASPYVFIVRNDGDHAEFIRIAVASGEASVEGPTVFSLAPNEERQIAVVHQVPASPGAAATATAVLRAFLADSPGRQATAELRTLIRDVTPPKASWARTVPTNWSAASPLELEARFSDDTALAEAKFQIRGATRSWDFAAKLTGVALLQVPLPVGTYRLSLVATDVHGNLGYGPNLTVSVFDSVPPQILDFAVGDEGGQRFVKARILTPRPPLAATLVIDAGPPAALDVEDGYVATSLSLSPGNHTVRIQASDADGREAFAEIQVNIPEPASTKNEMTDPAPTARHAAGQSGTLVAVLSLAGLAWNRKRLG